MWELCVVWLRSAAPRTGGWVAFVRVGRALMKGFF